MAKQILEIKQGKRPPVIETGNVDVTRDFSDVRDVLRGYLALLASGRAGETYNVCSGVERNVGHVLLQMLSLSGVKATVQAKHEKMRPNEQKRHCGSNRKLCDDTGWARASTSGNRCTTCSRAGKSYRSIPINGKKSADFRHHRAGWRLPRTIAAAKGL